MVKFSFRGHLTGMIPILRKAILRTVAEDQARLSAVRPTTRWAPWEPHRTLVCPVAVRTPRLD